MKRKEIISALGLSISLAVTACGTPAPQYERAEEVTEVTKEEPSSAPAPVDEKEKIEETSEEVNENNAGADTTEQEEVVGEAEEDAEYVIENIEPVAVMYATQQSNIRDYPCVDDSKVIGTLLTGQEVSVIGKTIYKDKTWYLLQNDEESNEKRFVSGSLLSEKKPSSGKTGDNKSSANTGTTVIPSSSDCAVADCGNDCNEYGDCDISGIPDLGAGTYCSASYCAQAE